MTPNQKAFLTLIGFSEGTDKATDPYRVCYAYKHAIIDFAEHPAVTGEWRGEMLSEAMCRGAGLGPGCVSTAAGRYQITRSTWVGARAALNLRDFTPASQDLACLWLIAQKGALVDVDAGEIGAAIVKCRKIWASFPGAGYTGQQERRLTALLNAYTTAGGTLAPSLGAAPP